MEALPPQHRLTIGCTLAEIARAAAWTDSLARSGVIAFPLLNDVQLCLEEALANVVLHGTGGEPDPCIAIEIASDPSQLSVTIIDNRAAFDPCAHEPPPPAATIEEATIGGRGIRLLRGYTKAMRYARIDEQNRLTLVFGQACA